MKVLYNTESQSVSAYPRADDEPVVGLDPLYLVLNKVETPAPSPTAVPTWEVDLDALEYRQSWTEPEPPPPDPDWMGFKADYKSSPTIRAWFAGLDPMDREDLAAMVAAQSISGVTAAMADVDYGSVRDELNGLLAKHHIGLQLP